MIDSLLNYLTIFILKFTKLVDNMGFHGAQLHKGLNKSEPTLVLARKRILQYNINQKNPINLSLGSKKISSSRRKETNEARVLLVFVLDKNLKMGLCLKERSSSYYQKA